MWISIIWINTWTWTLGSDKWDLQIIKVENINIPDNFKWVKSYEEFREKVKWKKSEFRNTAYKKVDNFLQSLREIVDIDPVKYLYYLYYEEKVSTIVIYDMLHTLGWYKNKQKDTFTKMFVNTFWWVIRDNSKITTIWKRRIIKANETKYWKQKALKTKKEQEIYKLFSWIYQKRWNTDVKLDNLEWTNMKKIKTFLNELWYTKNTISLKKYIQYLQNKYSLSVIANVLNKIIEENNWKLKVNKWNLSYLLNWKLKNEK